uniref:transmembrane emp24 domain-containing protein eca-like n=1 Tax=Ciona intestinalis TaxID=7719 RepID=UPI000180C5A2|nr:transmembrane emp24 domain-containing protein eca-like [Ciona intestinalis]|eukprot:XP_002131507.1 transmembrane emp24 domain-containing protein eca-like [Ciona intestinalis]
MLYRNSNMKLVGVCGLLLFVQVTSAIYFHVGEREKKCFIEDIAEETMLTAKYKTMVYNQEANAFKFSPPDLGMHVEISDPDKKVVLSKTYGPEGMFYFTSHSAGDHEICMYSNTTKWFGGRRMRVFFDIQSGEHAADEEVTAEKGQMAALEQRIQHLIDQIKIVQKNQNYQRFREKVFRKTSSRINYDVVWWSLAQCLVLVGSGLFQMRHLKSFFITKKLV